MHRSGADLPIPASGTRPTLDLLGFSWRFVLARVWLFAGLSGLFVIATFASYLVASVLTHAIGIAAGSAGLLGTSAWLIDGLIKAAASSLIAIPILAGIFGIVFRLFENDPEPIMGFSVLQKRYGSVVTVSLLASVATLAVSFVCRMAMPHEIARYVSPVLSTVMDAALFLALPAVVRFDLRPMDAFVYSVRRFSARPFAFLGYFLGTFVLAMAGSLACGVGVLFTLGVLIVAPALLLGEASSSAGPASSASELPQAQP